MVMTDNYFMDIKLIHKNCSYKFFNVNWEKTVSKGWMTRFFEFPCFPLNGFFSSMVFSNLISEFSCKNHSWMRKKVSTRLSYLLYIIYNSFENFFYAHGLTRKVENCVFFVVLKSLIEWKIFNWIILVTKFILSILNVTVSKLIFNEILN
jgi:hypothetical protein